MVLAALAVLVGIYAFLAWAVMMLWNVIAAHFGFPPVTFWVAGAVVLLVGILRPSVSVKAAQK